MSLLWTVAVLVGMGIPAIGAACAFVPLIVMPGMTMGGARTQTAPMAGMPMPSSSGAVQSSDTTHAAHADMATPSAPPAAPSTGSAFRAPGTLPDPVAHGASKHGPGNASTPAITRSRLGEPGTGLGNDGGRGLVYTDIRALRPRPDALRPPAREIEFHLTGNMERYMWSIDGKKFSESPEPIHLARDERVRLTLVNDTIMEHPMHLHGMWMELENGTLGDIPRVHTINVKPAERVSVLVTPHDPGPWAFHCHVLLHMEMGMFRVIQVGDSGAVARVES